ncbi:papain-like cysteine protease family protein [Spirosoma flavum]|uniref:Papain-like cysteine protease family protein n=1 Tax=Spirosoma flavum TaxID=2048557 RepID=A0ABW6AHT1_9BACT
MGRVTYDVPLVTQSANPICWVTCMAMVSSERLGYSLGVGHFASGFDPSNSSIPNQYNGQWTDYYEKLSSRGFVSVAVNTTASELENVLKNCGPVILTHQCAGFPYGPGWGPVATPGAMHAVVITGIDSAINGGTCWMNNPWGNKDRPLLTSAVIMAISQLQAINVQPIAYYQ